MQIGFVGCLTLLFVALKLTHVIDWEWVWVLSPVWISVIVGLLFFLGVLTAAWRSESREEKRRQERRMRGW